jgi:hypothetical protein
MDQPKLKESFAREILNPSIDPAVDYAEIALDALTTNEVIKEIPVIKSILAVFKTGVAIREWHFVRKLLTFLKEYHANPTEEGKTEEFRQKMNSDSVFCGKVANHLLVILDRYITEEKAKILAHLFKAHVNGQIGWEEFMSLSITLDSLHHSSYDFLHRITLSQTPFSYQGMEDPGEPLLFAAGIGTRYGTRFSVTPLGQMLYKHGIKPLRSL